MPVPEKGTKYDEYDELLDQKVHNAGLMHAIPLLYRKTSQLDSYRCKQVSISNNNVSVHNPTMAMKSSSLVKYLKWLQRDNVIKHFFN